MFDLPTWSTLPDWETISETSISSDEDSGDEFNNSAKQQYSHTGKRRRGRSHASSLTPPGERKRRHISPAKDKRNCSWQLNASTIIEDDEAYEKRSTPKANALVAQSGGYLASHSSQSPAHIFTPLKSTLISGEECVVNDSEIVQVVTGGTQSAPFKAPAQTTTASNHKRKNSFNVFPRRSLIPVTSSHSSSSSIGSIPKAMPIEPGYTRPRQAQPQWVRPRRAAATTTQDAPLQPCRELDLVALEALTEANVSPSVWRHQYLEEASESHREAALRWNLRHLKQLVELQGKAGSPTAMHDQSKTRSTAAIPEMSRSLRRDHIIDSIFGRNSEESTEDSPRL